MDGRHGGVVGNCNVGINDPRPVITVAVRIIAVGVAVPRVGSVIPGVVPERVVPVAESDSDPAAEETETRNKAAAVLAAIASAETLRAAR